MYSGPEMQDATTRSSNGWFCRPDGEGILYSPNCERTISVPRKREDPSEPQNPFVHGKPWEELRHPHRWTRAFGWATFIPRSLLTFDYPFDMLAFVPPPEHDARSDIYFGVPFSMEKEWNILADGLLETVMILIARYSIPAVAPYTSRAWKYGSPHRTYAQARTAAFRGRDWFMVWAGLIAFCIRFIEHHCKTQVNTLNRDSESHLPAHWRVQLREKGFSDAWIVSMELVAHAKIDRAGLFIEDVSEDPQMIRNGDPSCTWWVRCGVPFWMRWERGLWDTLQSSTYAWLLPHRGVWVDAGGLILETMRGDGQEPCQSFGSAEFTLDKAHTGQQDAEEDLTAEVVSSDEIMLHSLSTSGFQDATMEVPPGRKEQDQWALPSSISARVLFSRLELAEEVKLDTSLREGESSEQRLKRLNREHEPPIVNVKVFVFELDYDNPVKMIKHAVRRKERADTLNGFSAGQKCYLSSLNAWYCCEEWAPGTYGGDDDDDEDDGGDVAYRSSMDHDDNLGPSTLAQDQSMLNPVGEPYSPQEFALRSHIGDDLEHYDQPSDMQVLPDVTRSAHEPSSVEDRVLENIALLYGCVLPLPPFKNLPALPLDSKSRATFMRQLGYALNRPGVDSFLDGHCAPLVYKFVQASTTSTSQYQAEVKEMHDLQDECHLKIQKGDLARLTKVQTTTKVNLGNKDLATVWYLYDFGRGWAIAVDRPEAALTLCRLGRSQQGMEEMMRALVEMGFRFRTVGWMIESTLESLPVPRERCLPERRSDHHFDQQDYQEHLQVLESLFTDPRMRAAVLRGGVIWRIAYSFVGLEPVLRGPTYQQGLVLQNELNNDLYIDDDLTPTELKLIVGTYKCWTGLGNQTTLKSWWPPVEAFEGPTCGENYGVWNDFRERWYKDRRSKLIAGTAQPLTTDEWKKTLKGRKEVTMWKRRAHQEASGFLSSQLPPVT